MRLNLPIKKPVATGLVTAADSLQFKTNLKQAIAGLALRGIISYEVADWLIQEGRLAYD